MKNYNKHTLVILALLCVFNTLSAKTIYYVTANGTGDGSTWAKAASNIQSMIDKAVATDEVWVAKGTYYPTTETIARDARSKTFLLKAGINLYGGFAGTETAISQRILADLDSNGKIDSCELVNPTILSGNTDGIADVWTLTMNTDGKTWGWTVTGNDGNCYNVVTTSSKIDGFSVIGGNANRVNSENKGGGISASSFSSASVTNCTVSNCSASQGGGIYSYNSFSSVTNCTVSNCSASYYGGGIAASWSSVTNCTVSNCSASYGGGISASSTSVTNCTISNCSASTRGGGINTQSSPVTNCTISNCSAGISEGGGGIYTSSSPVTNCTISSCSAGTSGGGIYAISSSSDSPATNCTISNCSAGTSGGGIYAAYYSSGKSPATNCTISNCSAGTSGGGIWSFSSFVTNCTISNCSAGTSGGGIYTSSSVTNCASSNNSTAGTIGAGIGAGTPSSCISPSISDAYIQSTSFIGTAITDAQKTELLNANWRLKEGSPCINAGTATNVPSSTLTGKDIDNNLRVLYGTIDIGAYEYNVPTIQMPVNENFNDWTDFDKSNLFYRSAKLNTLNDNKWAIVNQKAVFSWQTNLTTTYNQPIYTYQIDGTKSNNVYLRYDMYFQAYVGTISPLGTEKLNVEFSTDLVTWSSIATYSNANGTIANQAYKYDISTLAAGKTFFIRFNANGANTNRIEKWEIDNVIIDANGLSAVDLIKTTNYKYLINNNKLIISNLQARSVIYLYDINGKIIDYKKAETESVQFKLPTRGAYLVKVTSNSGVENNKVVW